jgi:lipopolysaccharide/colanic/teichoic acid biosynthesis glycosyltransferase
MNSVVTPTWQKVIAFAGLIFGSPALGAAALWIKISDPGPAIHRATRAGLGGNPFTMYKLRTMRLDSELQGPITASDDYRIFPAGRSLRKFKLDELPQLINVVKGEMALVGPRPEAIDIVRDNYLPWMKESLAVPPGITGPGSLHYIQQERDLPADPHAALDRYTSTILPQKLAYELVYVRNRTFRYELLLIGRTLLRVASRREGSSASARWETEVASRILDEVATHRQAL